MKRSALKPHVWRSPLRNRSCDSGMRISIVQPSRSIDTADSQTPSHELSRLVSLEMTVSRCTPPALTSNEAPVRRSCIAST